MANSHKNKTVVDAVNYSKGSHEGLAGASCDFCFVTYWDNRFFKRGEGFIAFDTGLIICSEDEFNQCISEMSEGLFVPDCRPNNPEIQYDDEGKGWEIGAVYEFSDDGGRWALSELEGIKSSNTRYKYLALGCEWEMIRVVKNILKIGDIHKKPVELVDGGIYQFVAQGQSLFGVKDGSYLVVDKYQKYSIELCADIIKLVPESV